MNRIRGERVIVSQVTPVGLVLCLAAAIAFPISSWAETPGGSDSSLGSAPGGRAVRAGEFSVAKTIPAASLPSGRGAVLAQVAAAQSMTGESMAAANTVRQIDSPEHRQAAIEGVRGAAQGVAPQGGGSFADFDSLMALIETTVVPDTWEALGGSSTMAPYPQGIFVDPTGTVMVSSLPSDQQAMAKGAIGNLDALLMSADRAATVRDWRAPAKMRCVSLRRLRDEIASRRLTGTALGDELLNLAGMSSVQYVILADDDIVLAAPVGGIELDRGWYVDRESGRSTLRTDFLARCLAAAIGNTPFGCTIDPTPAGMQSAMSVAAQIRGGQIPMGKSAERLREALGMQRVEVFGAAGDTAVALLMVEADRHMKQLALGEQTMPEGAKSYLDVVDDFITQGPPDGLLLRLWFTAKPQAVRCDSEKRVFEIAGSAVQLSGENQRALADGGRGEIAVDPRSLAFVESFNQNWTRIRDQYPIYGALESLYRVAAVSHLIDHYGSEGVHLPLASGFAIEDESRDWMITAPKQVESIATLHSVRSGNKRHHVLLASGGVSVSTEQSVQPTLQSYPTLAGQISISKRRPLAVQQWWWDAN